MTLASVVQSRAAGKRGRLFTEFIDSFEPPIKIIDLGGTVLMWERWGLGSDERLKIDLANNFSMDVNNRDAEAGSANISKIDVDVVALRSADYEKYDIIFSNSMLEHLADFEQQRSVAQAIISSGKPFFVQIPNKYSLIDPHFAHPMAPFFGAWPRNIQLKALRLSGLNGGKRAKSRSHAEHRLKFYNPLSMKDIEVLFPVEDKKIVVERMFGVPMSIVVSLRR